MIDQQRRPRWARRIRKLGDDLQFALESWELPSGLWRVILGLITVAAGWFTGLAHAIARLV